ncbi:MAG: hypothetical protein AB7S77_18235 [Desulfatirhabdiaceae bacterium]
MTSTVQILIAAVFLVGAFVLSQVIVNRRLRATGNRILRELLELQALDAYSAVDLAYAKAHLLPKGLRDLRPKALNDLVQADIIGKTATGKFFLKKKPDELNLESTRPLDHQRRR